MNCADWGLSALGSTVWPSQVGYVCSAFDGVPVAGDPSVRTLPLKQSVGPGSEFVSAEDRGQFVVDLELPAGGARLSAAPWSSGVFRLK